MVTNLLVLMLVAVVAVKNNTTIVLVVCSHTVHNTYWVAFLFLLGNFENGSNNKV